MKISISIIIAVISLLVILSSSKVMKTSKILVALNCGMKQGSIKSDYDAKFDSDTNFVKGSSVDVDYHSDAGASSSDIKFAMDKQLYMFERHTYSQMTYQLPVKTGVHTIILKFAEMYFEKKNQRVFNIKIGDSIVVQNMDVFAKSGAKYAAHEQYIEVQVKNGVVYHNSQKLNHGIKGGKLQLVFSKGVADNPIVQAILVYHGPVQQTSKAEYQLLKQNWSSKQQMVKAKKQNQKIKELISMTKKQERLVIRNDQILQDEKKTQQQTSKPPKFGIIRSFLMSPIGILIWTAIILYKIIFIYKRIFKLGSKAPIVSTTSET